MFDNAIQCLSEGDRALPPVVELRLMLKAGIGVGAARVGRGIGTPLTRVCLLIGADHAPCRLPVAPDPFIPPLLPRAPPGVHHGGLLPLMKEVVELLFQDGFIKVRPQRGAPHMAARSAGFRNHLRWCGLAALTAPCRLNLPLNRPLPRPAAPPDAVHHRDLCHGPQHAGAHRGVHVAHQVGRVRVAVSGAAGARVRCQGRQLAGSLLAFAWPCAACAGLPTCACCRWALPLRSRRRKC